MRVFVLLLVSLFIAEAALNLKDHKRIDLHTHYLGRKKDPHHPKRSVDGYAFVHYQHDSPAATIERNLNLPSTALAVHFQRRNVFTHICSAPMSDGAYWKTSRGFYVMTKNQQGLSSKFVVDTISAAAETWRCVLSRLALMPLGPIIEVDDSRSSRDFDISTPDGLNTIGFGQIKGAVGALAVTAVWGVLSGDIENREITEFDMCFNEDRYRFGNATENRSVYDLLATAVHEAGHALGLVDQRDARCINATMHAESSIGELIKRTLEPDDMQGMLELYSLEREQ